MKVSWDYYSQHMEKMFQSAPTSHNDYDNNGVINYDNNGYKHHDLPIVSHEIPLGFSW